MSKVLYKDTYKDYTIVVRLAGTIIVTEINKKHRTEFTPIIYDNGNEGVRLTLIEYFNKKLYLKGLTDEIF